MLLIKGLTIKARSPSCWVSSTLTVLHKMCSEIQNPLMLLSQSSERHTWEFTYSCVEMLLPLYVERALQGQPSHLKQAPIVKCSIFQSTSGPFVIFPQLKKNVKMRIFWHQDHHRPKQVVLCYCHRNGSKRNKHKACLQLFSFRLPVPQ